VKIKVKFTPTKLDWHRGESRGIALLLLNLRAGWSGWSRFCPRPLYFQEKARLSIIEMAEFAPGPSGKMWRRESF